MEQALKRGTDLALASALMVPALPLMLVVAAAVKLSSRGSVIFRQRRVGQNGREFTMYKFRTMHADAPLHEERLAEENGDRVFLKIQGDIRVTRVGRLLRKFSLDELPQLLNVFNGDMSLVGPRPLLPSDMKRFPRGVWARRFTMRPGLTGLWQVSGRSLCSDGERIRLDLDYVDQWSPTLDLQILIRTPAVVLLAKGAC
ncbi:MAG TPA: sugar transferase [Longimicrobiales bacterium]|nr:sugar transferase [Longimicrobiales bacterium]